MHTTYPWTGEGERKSIFYKYSCRDESVPTLTMHGAIGIDEQPGRQPHLLRDRKTRTPQGRSATHKL